MFKEVEFVIDESSVKLAHAIRVTEEICTRVSEIVSGTVGYVVRDLDLFHLISIDRMRAEIARDR